MFGRLFAHLFLAESWKHQLHVDILWIQNQESKNMKDDMCVKMGK